MMFVDLKSYLRSTTLTMITVFLAALSTTQLITIILVLVFLFLGFKLLESNWSYRISKPYLWEEAVKDGRASKRLRKVERFYRDKVRFYTFWFQIERLKKEAVAGAFAEVGVYKGETARIIYEMDPVRILHLFDTFEGFDSKDLAAENNNDEKAPLIDFSDTTVETVKLFINGNNNIVFHKGHFPSTSENLKETKYAFVHLDADLYQPTLAALKYFYPRLSGGGVIMVHDYNHTWEGVRKAVDEFIKEIPESLVEVADWQGSVMIVRTRVDN